jgi:ATP-binding protein involved in chromosome partitioning
VLPASFPRHLSLYPARLEVPFLGEIPLFSDIRICGDKGVPIVVAEPNSAPAQAFTACAESVLRQLK